MTDATGNALVHLHPRDGLADRDQLGLTTVDLGNLDTTGFADGSDTITVTVADQSGSRSPAATGQGSLVIGLPVTASSDDHPDDAADREPRRSPTRSRSMATRHSPIR